MNNRRTGKIARLPRQLRDLVNRSLDDGVPYKDIIARLEDNAHLWPPDLDPITEQNMSTWFDTGYKDWLREQAVLNRLEVTADTAARVIRQSGEEPIQQAVFQVAASQLFELLSEFNLPELKETLPGDPANYHRLLIAVARLNRGALDLEKFRDHVRQRKERIEAELRKADSSGGISPESRTVIESELQLL